MKIGLWIVVLLWAMIEFIQSIKKYRKYKERTDLVSLIALSIMIPSGIILLISEVINK